jgi:hypothetical protein
MNHHIDKTKFGSIQIEGITYNHDVIIRLDGAVKKRKKKLSKAIYGTSHKVSLDEAQYVYEKGAERLIIGCGQYGALHLSNEAELFFQEKGIKVEISLTPEAIQLWNNTKGKAIGLFHVTC